jgi:hypothetical protein
MATRMQQRKGTEAQWISTNNGNGPVLNAGEIGYETDTNKFKIGDGINHWVDLNYFADEVALGGNIDDYIPLTQRGTANGVATLNSDGVIPSSQIPSLVGLDSEITSAVSTAITNLVDGAPFALDTLNEIAAAMADDANYATTVITALNTKAPLASPTFTGTVNGISAAMVGLGNVNNTSDANKPVSDAVATALSAKLNSSEAGATAVEAVYNKLNGGTGIDITQDGTSKVITVAIDSTVATETYADTAASGAVSTHSDDTTSVHGIADTANLVTLAGTQQLTNKTLAEPTITHGTSPSQVSISSLEISYLDGLTTNINTKFGDIDTALGNKVNSADLTALAQDAVGGSIGTGLSYDTVTNVLSVNQTSMQARVSGVSDVEIGYLDGVTSAIQTQLDAKLASSTAESTYAPIASPTFTGTVAGVTKAHVGLGNVDNTSDANKPVSTATQTALDLKANLASPALTGTPTAPTATAGTNTTQVATTAFVGTAVSALVASAPGALDTLNELANALGNDASFSTTVTNSIATKAPIASPTFTGTVTIPAGASISGFATLANPTFTGTVTLPSGTITTAMIADGAVATIDIADSAVTSAKIANDTIVNADINSAAAIDWTKLAISSTVSATELGYVDGVTSAIQTQLDSKVASVSTINAQTASYTLVLADRDKFVELGVSSGNTVTVPTNATAAFPVGTKISIIQTGTGQTTITPASGVTVNGTPGLKTRAQWSAVTLVKRATDTWVAFGDLTA